MSLIVLPVAFGSLTRENAGIFARRIFPKYHIILFIASQLAGFLAYTSHIKIVAYLSALIFALHFLFLTPSINKASDESNMQLFKRLHIVSVLLHLLVVSLFIYALMIDGCFGWFD
jgi:hypothetical protein